MSRSLPKVPSGRLPPAPPLPAQSICLEEAMGDAADGIAQMLTVDLPEVA